MKFFERFISTVPVGFFQALLQNWLWDPGPGQRYAIRKAKAMTPNQRPPCPPPLPLVEAKAQLWCPTPGASPAPPLPSPPLAWKRGAAYTAGAVGPNHISGLG